jgi:Tfp pilus assembly protein PilN
MIKINLLDSVTDRPKGVVVVEQKVANPLMQTLLMGGVVAFLLVVAIGWDYVSAASAHATAQKQLDEQQRIAAQMAAVNKEQAELEKKTKDVQARIDAIQNLRASQKGPVAVLKELMDRIDGVPGLYLESVQQKGEELVIKGNSPNEAAVTLFGRSLEFSSGLFTNLNIETQRKELPLADAAAAPVTPGQPLEKPETVDFTIRCSYTPSKASTPEDASAPGAAKAPSNQVAQK